MSRSPRTPTSPRPAYRASAASPAQPPAPGPAKPPTAALTPAPADAAQQALWQFPCAFPVKVLGRNDSQLRQAMVALVQRHDPGFDAACVEVRASRAGTYVGLTLTLTATSKAQLDALYRELSAHPLVKVVL